MRGKKRDKEVYFLSNPSYVTFALLQSERRGKVTFLVDRRPTQTQNQVCIMRNFSIINISSLRQSRVVYSSKAWNKSACYMQASVSFFLALSNKAWFHFLQSRIHVRSYATHVSLLPKPVEKPFANKVPREDRVRSGRGGCLSNNQWQIFSSLWWRNGAWFFPPSPSTSKPYSRLYSDNILSCFFLQTGYRLDMKS